MISDKHATALSRRQKQGWCKMKEKERCGRIEEKRHEDTYQSGRSICIKFGVSPVHTIPS